ncbi:MAG TPA: hypothetical protein VF727_00850 [Allosphingosinicella sp.]|jgi:hypothetical protein
MPNASDMLWFKTQFQAQVNAGVAGTPFDLDMVTAIASQETGHIWSRLRKTTMTVERILELCVGDTLDAPNRSAFPKNKAALLAAPNGLAMFNIARAALVDMAQHVPGFPASNPNKFCHGYGIFQYDIQFFKVDPQYFLQRRYIHFDESLGKCLSELQAARKRIGFGTKTHLSDFEMAAVAIAYNTGRFKPEKGLKQGFFDGEKFYGERFADFLALARSVPTPAPGPVPQPAPALPTGKLFRVAANGGTLRLRSAAKVAANNVVASLPDGQVVSEVSATLVNGFRQVEATVADARLRGFAGDAFLQPEQAAPAPAPIPVIVAEPVAPAPAKLFRVDTNGGTLRLRSSAAIAANNVIARLPNGHQVSEVSPTPINGFREVETMFAGAALRGFAGTEFLKPVRGDAATLVTVPANPTA